MTSMEYIKHILPATGYKTPFLSFPFWTAILTIACAISSGWRALLLPLALPLMARTLALYVPCRPRLIFWTTIIFGLMPVIRPQVIATEMDALRLLLGTNLFFWFSKGIICKTNRRYSILIAFISAIILCMTMRPLLDAPTEPHVWGYSWVRFSHQLPFYKIFHAPDLLRDSERDFYLDPNIQPSVLGLFTVRYTSINLLLFISLAILIFNFFKGDRKFQHWIPTAYFVVLYGVLTLLGRHHIEYMLPVLTPIFPILFIIAAQCAAPFRIADINFRSFYCNVNRSCLHKEHDSFSCWLYPLLIVLLSATYIKTFINIDSIILYDSISYEQAWDNFRNGIPNPVRTPLYPLFIGLCKTCFGLHYLYAVVGCQIIATIGSIFMFSRLARRFISNEWLIFCGAIFVFMNPDIACSACVEMTETFSMLAVLLYTDSFVRSFAKGKTAPIIESMFWSIVMIALKPGLLWVLPLESMAWIFFAWSKKSLRLWGLVISAVAVPVLLLHIYAAPIKNYYGVKSFSHIGAHNFLIGLSAMGVVDAEDCADPILRTKLAKIYSDSVKTFSDPVSYTIGLCDPEGLHEYPWKDRFKPLDNFVDKTMKDHLWDFPEFVWKRLSIGVPNARLIQSESIVGNSFLRWTRPFMSTANMLLILFFIIILWQFIRQRHLLFNNHNICSAIVFCIPWAMYLSNYIVSVISGYGDRARLNLDVWPLLVLMVLQLLSLLRPIQPRLKR